MFEDAFDNKLIVDANINKNVKKLLEIYKSKLNLELNKSK